MMISVMWEVWEQRLLTPITQNKEKERFFDVMGFGEQVSSVCNLKKSDTETQRGVRDVFFSLKLVA